MRASISALAQVVIQAPGLSFRCICHPVNPIKTRCESGFCLLCTSHGPCCVSTSHQVRKMRVHWCVPSFSGGIWVSSWEEASHVQVLSEDFTTRQRLSLSPTSCLARVQGERSLAVKRCLLHYLDALAGYHGVIRLVNSRCQVARMRSWKTALNLTSQRSTGRSKLTINCRQFSSPRWKNTECLFYGDRSQSIFFFDGRLPLQCRNEEEKIYPERISKDIEKKQQARLEILQKWIETDQELESANAKQIQAKQSKQLNLPKL